MVRESLNRPCFFFKPNQNSLHAGCTMRIASQHNLSLTNTQKHLKSSAVSMEKINKQHRNRQILEIHTEIWAITSFPQRVVQNFQSLLAITSSYCFWSHMSAVFPCIPLYCSSHRKPDW